MDDVLDNGLKIKGLIGEMKAYDITIQMCKDRIKEINDEIVRLCMNTSEDDLK